MTEIDHQKKLDVNTMIMYTKSDPKEHNRRKPSSERNNEYLRENNMTKTISNTQYMPDNIVINITTSNIHNIIPSTTASNTISNNIYLKRHLPANNIKIIQTTPSTIIVPAFYTTNFSSVTRHLQNLSQQTHLSQTNTYTLFQSKGYTSLKTKIKQPLVVHMVLYRLKLKANHELTYSYQNLESYHTQ